MKNSDQGEEGNEYPAIIQVIQNLGKCISPTQICCAYINIQVSYTISLQYCKWPQ